MRVMLIEKYTLVAATYMTYSQLSNIIGHSWVSKGYLCNFMGHDNIAEILKWKIEDKE